MAKVDLRRIARQEALADASEYAFEEWESAQLQDEWWVYPYEYPVSSKASSVVGRYAKQLRRSQQVVLGSRSTAHG